MNQSNHDVAPGTLLDLMIERPAVGGRMIARHAGRIILVLGAIPGERVRARVERSRRDMSLASVEEVIAADKDRRPTSGETSCGGNVFAHIAYPRQLSLKREIVADAFARIGRLSLPEGMAIAPSPERGYRLRARLYVAGTRLGFLHRGSHRPCDAAGTGQLTAETGEVLDRLQRVLALQAAGIGIRAVDLAESIAGDQRAAHLWLDRGRPASAETLSSLGAVRGITGVSASVRRADPQRHVSGDPVVAEPWSTMLPSWPRLPESALCRRPAAFFQGNRFLLASLIERVLAELTAGPVVDLYAGVGVFALAAAASGADDVTAVEDDPISADDLAANARAAGGRVRVVRRTVERYLRASQRASSGIWIVDPPRTGLSRDARGRIASAGPPRLVYVSCDVATLARDLRALGDAGYTLRRLDGFDLFPNTAHIELVATLER